MRRSTDGPSTIVSPSNSKPSSRKNAFTASRSSTTMRTLSIRSSLLLVIVNTRHLAVDVVNGRPGQSMVELYTRGADRLADRAGERQWEVRRGRYRRNVNMLRT